MPRNPHTVTCWPSIGDSDGLDRKGKSAPRVERVKISGEPSVPCSSKPSITRPQRSKRQVWNRQPLHWMQQSKQRKQDGPWSPDEPDKHWRASAWLTTKHAPVSLVARPSLSKAKAKFDQWQWNPPKAIELQKQVSRLQMGCARRRSQSPLLRLSPTTG